MSHALGGVDLGGLGWWLWWRLLVSAALVRVVRLRGWLSVPLVRFWRVHRRVWHLLFLGPVGGRFLILLVRRRFFWRHDGELLDVLLVVVGVGLLLVGLRVVLLVVLSVVRLDSVGFCGIRWVVEISPVLAHRG